MIAMIVTIPHVNKTYSQVEWPPSQWSAKTPINGDANRIAPFNQLDFPQAMYAPKSDAVLTSVENMYPIWSQNENPRTVTEWSIIGVRKNAITIPTARIRATNR